MVKVPAEIRVGGVIHKGEVELTFTDVGAIIEILIDGETHTWVLIDPYDWPILLGEAED